MFNLLFKQIGNYIKQNRFKQLSKKVFRRIIGIPLELDSAYFTASLFLYYYEHKWVSKI